MQLFKHSNTTLSSLREVPFQLEKEIQILFEKNMESLTGFILIKSEFSIKHGRIDTLAFDPENRAFVIIEYKRSQNYSVIDQGFSYLNLMLENEADFIIEYNETQQISLKRADVDWSQSRILFISPSFTDFQKQSTNFKDLAIELWEIKRFEDDMIMINPIKKSKSAPSIRKTQINSDSVINKVTKEIKVYAEEDHLQGKNDATVELYEIFKDAILNLGSDIDIKPQKMVIGFTHHGKVFADVLILKSELKLWINLKMGNLDDPKNLSRDVSQIGRWGKGEYEIRVGNTANLEYIMSLVKQALSTI